MKILVTGGFGFIGSHLIKALLNRGDDVLVLDNLSQQVHGNLLHCQSKQRSSVTFYHGDIRDTQILKKACLGVDIIVHLASTIGVGQSMYQIYKYVGVNSLGTAALLQTLIDTNIPLTKFILASSMSVYGEGDYKCVNCGAIRIPTRPEIKMREKIWEPECPKCKKLLEPIKTGEKSSLLPRSIYAITKKNQEDLVLTFCKVYGIPVTALRLFNVYGPGQSLSNPYTGVGAIFSCRLLNQKAPIIFEDGLQTRDFIHVNDVVSAILLAIDNPLIKSGVFNVGSGKPITIYELYKIMAEEFHFNQEPVILHKYRVGDIRHCFADIAKIEKFGFKTEIDIETGIKELISWVRSEKANDFFDTALSELKRKDIVI